MSTFTWQETVLPRLAAGEEQNDDEEGKEEEKEKLPGVIDGNGEVRREGGREGGRERYNGAGKKQTKSVSRLSLFSLPPHSLPPSLPPSPKVSVLEAEKKGLPLICDTGPGEVLLSSSLPFLPPSPPPYPLSPSLPPSPSCPPRRARHSETHIFLLPPKM